MPENDEVEAPIRDCRRLTPERRSVVQRCVFECARVSRARFLRDLFARMLSWRRRRTAISKLNALDDRMLKDVGLHRSQIEAAVRGDVPARFAGAA